MSIPETPDSEVGPYSDGQVRSLLLAVLDSEHRELTRRLNLRSVELRKEAEQQARDDWLDAHPDVAAAWKAAKRYAQTVMKRAEVLRAQAHDGGLEDLTSTPQFSLADNIERSVHFATRQVVQDVCADVGQQGHQLRLRLNRLKAHSEAKIREGATLQEMLTAFEFPSDEDLLKDLRKEFEKEAKQASLARARVLTRRGQNRSE